MPGLLPLGCMLVSLSGLKALLEASVPDLRQSCEARSSHFGVRALVHYIVYQGPFSSPTSTKASLLRDSSLTASMQSLSEALLATEQESEVKQRATSKATYLPQGYLGQLRTCPIRPCLPKGFSPR